MNRDLEARMQREQKQQIEDVLVRMKNEKDTEIVQVQKSCEN